MKKKGRIRGAAVALLFCMILLPACTGNAAAVTGEETEQRFKKNEWGYVDASLDVSEGIPADAEGRLKRISEKGVLTVAMEPYYAPQEFIDPSLEGQAQYVGADVELAKRIAERMGVELEIVPLSFSKVLSDVRDGKYDLAISGLSFTPGRADTTTMSKGYHFSDEIGQTGILIREADKDKLKSLEDLAGCNIAAQSGSLQETYLGENVPRYVQFRRLSLMTDVYHEVESGRADAVAADIENAKLYIESEPDCGLILMDGIVFTQEEEHKGDRVAAPPGEEMLIAFVNGVIDEVLSDGTYEKWFDEFTKYAEKLDL